MLACARTRITLFFQTLVLADVRRAITHQHTEGSVSISALFYLQSLSVANIVCVQAFLPCSELCLTSVCVCRVQPGFTVSGVKGFSRWMQHSGCMTVLCNAAGKYPEDMQADLCSKAARTIHSSCLLCRAHLKWLPALCILWNLHLLSDERSQWDWSQKNTHCDRKLS